MTEITIGHGTPLQKYKDKAAALPRKEINSEVVHLWREQDEYAQEVQKLKKEIQDLQIQLCNSTAALDAENQALRKVKDWAMAQFKAGDTLPDPLAEWQWFNSKPQPVPTLADKLLWAYECLKDLAPDQIRYNDLDYGISVYLAGQEKIKAFAKFQESQ